MSDFALTDGFSAKQDTIIIMNTMNFNTQEIHYSVKTVFFTQTTTLTAFHFFPPLILLFKLFTNCIAAWRYFMSASMARNLFAYWYAFS